MLVNKAGNNPVHIGPVMIHHRKLVSSYRFIGSSLKRIDDRIKNLKVFGTDDEENIITAFNAEFPEAVNLQCFRHFLKNVEKRLSKWKLADREEVSYFLLLI